MRILFTGIAGFIGFNFCLSLLINKKNKNLTIYGIDNLDNYYSTIIKKKRIKILKNYKNFNFTNIDISNNEKIKSYLSKKKIDIIFHFAAQAGVRYSVINPQKYIDVNIKGFVNLLQGSIKCKPKKIFYASSSSVYGDSKKLPSEENDKLNPKNIYAMSKVFNENYAEQFSKDNKIKLVGLRFFTVYGEFGRPDMLIGKLINKINNKLIFEVNNKGNHTRDFTYIGDICSILDKMIKIKYNKKHSIFNICSNNPVNIMKVTNEILRKYGKTKIKFTKQNKLDVLKTHGSNKKLLSLIRGFKFTPINNGLDNTIKWFKKNPVSKYY